MKEPKTPGKEVQSASRLQATLEPPSAAVDPRSAAGNRAVQSLFRSGGGPLPASLRNQLESDFDAGFADVRIHTDDHANAAARSVGARAFAFGNDIAFARGRFDPGTPAGMSLLTHEMTHVAQQARSSTPIGIQRQTDAGVEQTEQAAPPATGIPLEDVREALGEVSPIAGVGNFPKAFSILNGLSMHDLLWTLDALVPNAQIQVLAGNIEAARAFDMPRLQLAINVVQNLRTAGVTDPGVIPDSISAQDRKEIADYIGISINSFENESLRQAAAFKPTGNSTVEILQQLSLIGRNLIDVERDLLSINIAPDLALAKELVRLRHDRLAASGDYRQILRWGPATAAQLDIVVRAGAGLSGAKSQLLAAKSERGRIEDIPPYVRRPLLGVALAFAEAARSSNYAQTGYGLLAQAEHLAKTLQIDILKETLEDASDLLNRTKSMSEGKLDLTGRIPSDFSGQLETARSLIDKDPEKAHEITRKLQQPINELHRMAFAVTMATRLEGVEKTIRETIKKCAEENFLVHISNLLVMLKSFRPLEGHWQDLKDAYVRKDEKARESAWKVVESERKTLGELLAKIDKEMRDAYHDIQISNLIFHLTVLVLIAVLTWGAGLFFEGLAAGLELTEGGFAAGALITGGEALTLTIATTVIEKDPNIGKFAKEFAFNWITFGAMRRISLLYRALLGPAAKTLPGAASELLVMFALQTETSLLLAERQKRAEGKEGLTDAEAQNIVFEGVVVGVATMIAGRVSKKFMPDLQLRGGAASMRLAEINKSRAELLAEVKPYLPQQPPETGSTLAPGKPEPSQKRIGPQDKEKFQRIVELDAESLKLEGEFLEELSKAAASDPTSKEARQLKAAMDLHTAAMQKNQAARLHLALEPAGTNEMFCDQGAFDELLEYESKNGDVTVVKGRDADGARNIVVTPKPPSTEPSLRITERLTPGTDTAIAASPEPVNPSEPLPVESKYKPFEEMLNEDGSTFKDEKLENAYQKYTKKKPAEQKSRKEWARSQTSEHYRPSLEAELGPDFFKEAQQLIDIRGKPRPRDYTPDRYLADESTVRVHIEKVLQKAGIKRSIGIRDGKMTVSAFNGAKGKVAEILARVHQADVLAAIRVEHPNAVILRGVKIQYRKGGALTEAKLYTDDLIGEYKGNDLYLYGRFEVKSGPGGGYEATVQFHSWVEKRLEAGSVLLIPGRPEVAYGPTPGQRAKGMGAVYNMTSSKTYIIAPKGAEHLGLESEMQTTTEHERIALSTSADEIEYLTRILLEPYITPKVE